MIYIILIFISAVAKGICDKIQFQPSLFWWQFDWWLAKGKYSWDKRSWWTKNVFSFVSDGWHFFDAIRVFSLCSAVVIGIGWTWWSTIILYAFHGVIFEVIYRYEK